MWPTQLALRVVTSEHTSPLPTTTANLPTLPTFTIPHHHTTTTLLSPQSPPPPHHAQVNYSLGFLLETRAEDIYRMKGILAIAGSEYRFVYQVGFRGCGVGVHQRWGLSVVRWVCCGVVGGAHGCVVTGEGWIH